MVHKHTCEIDVISKANSPVFELLWNYSQRLLNGVVVKVIAVIVREKTHRSINDAFGVVGPCPVLKCGLHGIEPAIVGVDSKNDPLVGQFSIYIRDDV